MKLTKKNTISQNLNKTIKKEDIDNKKNDNKKVKEVTKTDSVTKDEIINKLNDSNEKKDIENKNNKNDSNTINEQNNKINKKKADTDTKNNKSINDKNKKETNTVTQDKNTQINNTKTNDELKLGKNEFIKTLNKKIKKDYDSLHNLNMENHRISQELEECRELSEINKLLDRIKRNKKDVKDIIDRIDNIKSGNIVGFVYDYSKTQPRVLKDYINFLQTKPNNDFYLKELYIPFFKDKLVYEKTINDIKKETDEKEIEVNAKRNNFERLDDKEEINNSKIEKYNKRKYYFKNLLLKYQISLNSFKEKVNKISIVQKVTKRYFLGNTEIKSNMQLKAIAMQIAHANNRDARDVFEDLKNNLTIIASSKLVPSNNYKSELLEEKQNLSITGKELTSSLSEVRKFKNEFKEEFYEYYENDEYFEYLDTIEKIEHKFENEQEKLEIIDNSIDKTIIENDLRVSEIEKLNIGRNNNWVMQNNNQQMQNQPNQPNQVNQVNQVNQPNQQTFQSINNFYNQQSQEHNFYVENDYEEEHRMGGRSR